MIIDCIGDLHGYYPKLEGGDLLIVAGDLTARDTVNEYQAFCYWLFQQDYKKKIVISGNHDNQIQKIPLKFDPDITDCEYLCDSATEFEYEELNCPNGVGRGIKKHTLKIWGSPWTLKFPGMNPHCMAFTCDTEEELAEKWALIPEDTDILVTHGPPYGLGRLDELHSGDNVGSYELRTRITQLKLKIHVFGHIHEQGGGQIDFKGMKLINASHVNERYEPVNKPIRVIL